MRGVILSRLLTLGFVGYQYMTRRRATALGRKQTLIDEFWGSAFEKLLRMDTAESEIQEFSPE